MIKMESKLHIRQVMSCLLMLAVCIPLAAKKNYDFKVDGLYYKIIGDGKVEVTYEKENSKDNYKKFYEVNIPAEVEHKKHKYKVDRIGDGAFNKSGIYCVYAWNIREVGSEAFRNCERLAMISLGRERKIGEIAFYDCKKLHTVIMSDSLESIGQGAFAGCSNLKALYLPTKLKKISEALLSLSGVKKLKLPKNIEEIGKLAFAGTPIEEISLPKGLKLIGNSAFARCENLKEIYLPDSVEIVEENAFYGNATKISYYQKTKFEGDIPENSEKRLYTPDELIEQERLKMKREDEKERQASREEVYRKPIRWAANVSEAKKAVIQAEYDDMVFIGEGKFEMGAKKGYRVDVKGHTVSLSPYLIGKNSVSQELWRAVMGYNPSQNPSDSGPVDNVSWNDCMEFIRKLRKMTGIEFCLPTEAQWEYAAKGGAKSKGYYYAGTSDPDDLYRKDRYGNLHNISNELGLYGMSGGVYEWCADWFGPYSDVEVKNPTGPASGNGRVMRSGGGTVNYGGNIKQVTDRNWGG